MKRPRLPRPSMVMLPNGLTLASLFCGIFAIVSAARGEHERAGWLIIIAGVADAMDGRIARATGTGSRFGEELDSLVDAISFGLAPAFMMYFAVLHREGWDWIFVFLFAAFAVMRLARFNVEQAGRAKTHFRGLPSPAAGGVLATYFWFSQTPLYNQTLIGDLPWHVMVRFLMVGLGLLMISNVPYPAWPTFSARTLRGAIGLILFVGLLIGLIFLPKQFFFPVGVAYVLYGILASAIKGLLVRQPRLDDDDSSASSGAYAASGVFDDDAVADEEEDADEDVEPRPRRRRRRRGRPGASPNERPHPEGSKE